MVLFVNRCSMNAAGSDPPAINKSNTCSKVSRSNSEIVSGSFAFVLGSGEDYQLSSHLSATRPLVKRRPLPALSSFLDCISAALICAVVRSGFARVIHSFNAAPALRCPVRALSTRSSLALSSTTTVVIRNIFHEPIKTSHRWIVANHAVDAIEAAKIK